MSLETLLDDYQKEAAKTAIYPNRGSNLVYTVLGLVEETMELKYSEKENIEKELGDVFWYLSQIYYELGESFSKIITNGPLELSFLDVPSMVAGRVKKIIRDDNSDISNKKESVKRLLEKMFVSLQVFAEGNGLDINYVLKKNIEKLQKRKEKGTLKGDGDNSR